MTQGAVCAELGTEVFLDIWVESELNEGPLGFGSVAFARLGQSIEVP
jgi:hypothetical protein